MVDQKPLKTISLNSDGVRIGGGTDFDGIIERKQRICRTECSFCDLNFVSIFKRNMFFLKENL
jgi:hypothetical protein